MIYLLTAIGLPPSASSTVHIYTNIIHRTTQTFCEITAHISIKTLCNHLITLQLYTERLLHLATKTSPEMLLVS